MKENKIMREEIQSWPWKSFLLLGFNLQHMIVNDWDRDHDYAVGWKPDQEKEDSWRSREGLSFTLSSLPNIPFMSSTSVSFSFLLLVDKLMKEKFGERVNVIRPSFTIEQKRKEKEFVGRSFFPFGQHFLFLFLIVKIFPQSPILFFC